MLTSKPKKKRRGRPAPEYGPRFCPLCARKLQLGKSNEGIALLVCQCGWKE
jgi:hypothetical protein